MIDKTGDSVFDFALKLVQTGTCCLFTTSFASLFASRVNNLQGSALHKIHASSANCFVEGISCDHRVGFLCSHFGQGRVRESELCIVRSLIDSRERQ